MKKTLAAVAVLGAFAGSAIAADVTLYGVVDTGVGYNHVDFDGYGAKDDIDSFSMMSGQASGSRWGLKGTEDLGNGLTVGFILEDGIKSDTGVDDGVMFNRESSLFLQGDFGRFAMGRLGAINNGQSSWAKMGMLSAFGTSDWGGYSAQLSNLMSTAGQWDNMIAYETPKFAGFQVFAQYSMGNSEEGAVENESSADRYYAIGATYENGPFAAYLAVDSKNYKSWVNNTAKDTDDSLTVTLGGSYDFEVAKVYLGGQYFDEVTLSSLGGIIKGQSLGEGAAKVKGYGLTLSADAPVAGGKVMAGLGYVDAEAADSEDQSAAYKDLELTRYAFSVGYDYPFSKRTDVYAVASYMQDQLDRTATESNDLSAYTVYVGLRHKF